MEIISFICDELKILEERFYAKCNRFEFVRVRVICSIILLNMGYKHSYIASNIKRDRSMIYHYEKLHQALIYSDRHYRDDYERIIQKLKDNNII